MEINLTKKRVKSVLENLNTPGYSVLKSLTKRLEGKRARRADMSFKETLKELLSLKVVPEAVPSEILKTPLGEEITFQEAILLVQIIKAVNGDTQSAVYIRDTSGNKPKEAKGEDGVKLESLI